MSMENLFRQVRDLIAVHKFDELSRINIIKPDRFNWVKEVFEAIHVKDNPEATALIWTDGESRAEIFI